MRTEWKKGTPKLVHYLVSGDEEHAHFIGPYHNKPSKKLVERKGARVVSYNLIEIK